MTTCAECLSAMRTSRMADWDSGSQVALHCSTCVNCATVAEELRYAEHQLARALNEQKSGIDASEITVAALDGSEIARRRDLAKRFRWGLVAASLMTMLVFLHREAHRRNWFGFNDMMPMGPQAGMVSGAVATRTITLKCITPDQAMTIATPYLRRSAGIYPVNGIPAITLRGVRREVDRALVAIDEIDVKCQLPQADIAPAPNAPPSAPGARR